MVYVYPFIQTVINAHLAVYLILQMDSIANGAKKKTSPNVIRIQLKYMKIELERSLKLQPRCTCTCLLCVVCVPFWVAGVGCSLHALPGKSWVARTEACLLLTEGLSCWHWYSVTQSTNMAKSLPVNHLYRVHSAIILTLVDGNTSSAKNAILLNTSVLILKMNSHMLYSDSG